MINKKSGTALGVILAALLTVLVISRPWSHRSEIKKEALVVPVASVNQLAPVQTREFVQAPAAPLPTEEIVQSSSPYGESTFHWLMQTHNNLGLSESEKGEMLQAFLRVSQKRLAYEASIAKNTEISKTENFVEIPAYAEEGKKLEAELFKGFAQIVGADRIEPIKQALAGELYAKSLGWGESPQEISIRVSEIDPNVYEFTHRAGMIHPIINNTRMSVTYNGTHSRLFKNDLDHYAAFSSFLPKS